MAYAICLRYNIDMKPLRKIKIIWSPNLAYAIGLITTDGCLSGDGRHIDFTSKDMILIKTLLKCLGIRNKIGRKTSGYSGRKQGRVQFGDVIFYRFMLGIGLTPAKSKTMADLDIPQKHFFDFLRGHFDGDGTFYSYFDKRWKNSFMFYTVFISASKAHIDWLRGRLNTLLKIKGHITHDPKKGAYQLKYAKRESMEILREMYYNLDVVCLKRKRHKVEKALGVVGLEL
ncbi:MAG: hypothetical protein Q8P07_01365 [bacterium]|nr:hypothetical protein [bacterium]